MGPAAAVTVAVSDTPITVIASRVHSVLTPDERAAVLGASVVGGRHRLRGSVRTLRLLAIASTGEEEDREERGNTTTHGLRLYVCPPQSPLPACGERVARSAG